MPGRAVARIAGPSNRARASVNSRDSKLQFRLLAAATRQGGAVAAHEGPAHARHLAGRARDDGLDAAAGPWMTGAPGRRWSDPGPRNGQDDTSWNVTVECAAVARATGRQLSRLVGGSPQFTTIRCWLDESSNERKPAWASWLTSTGG